MNDEKVGRNDLCPCGSGKKYKKCCLGQDERGTGDIQGIGREIEQAMEGHDFGSLAEMQAFVDELMQQRNAAPVDELQGLSPNEMHQLLYAPWSSPQLIAFPDPLDVDPDAPIVTLFGLLVEAIGESGLKPTATGNLPRNFCREAALRYMGEEGYAEHTKFGGINSEPDVHELHVTRLVAEMAGLIRKYKGRFVLTRECRSLLKNSGMAGVYPRLFRAYVQEYNWGYGDGYGEIPFIQQSFAFTLYLLQRYGETERPREFYEDAFLDAFPMLLEQVASRPHLSAEKRIRSAYLVRALGGFAHFLGLARVQRTSEELLNAEYRVLALPLLRHAIRFGGGT